jgi:hypothetical protein
LLAALGLAGPVFALIQEPQYGWSSAMVAVPLLAGLAMLALFVWWEGHTHNPMLPLSLFKSRNFAVGNVTTLALYAGLSAATFLLALFLQETAGYTALQAGLSLLPLTVLTFALSRRFGALGDRLGPRPLMSAGPVIAGAGLLLMMRIDASGDYVSQVLPGVIVFGLGLSATVAPLTATVLSSVEEGHAGLASGVNNAVSRVAGLLAIAALGAVVASAFQARLDQDINPGQLSTQGQAIVQQARTRPLIVTFQGGSARDRVRIHAALVDASVHAFRIGMEVGAGLAVIGGLIALVGIENPRRRVKCADCQPPAASTTGANLSGQVSPAGVGAATATPPAPALSGRG